MAGTHSLQNVSLFANLSVSELEPLAQRLMSRKYREGERVLSQGSPGNSLYIVKSGRVAIQVSSGDGSTHTLAQFGPGQVFGEFALLDGLPRSATAIAQERSELLILTRPEFFMYLEQHPAVAINLLVLLSRRLRFTLQRIEEDEEAVSPVGRLARLLTGFAERYGEPQGDHILLSIRLTQGELAGIMGCPRSEAGDAMQVLQQKGLITTHGLQITICDLNALRAIVSEQ